MKKEKVIIYKCSDCDKSMRLREDLGKPLTCGGCGGSNIRWNGFIITLENDYEDEYEKVNMFDQRLFK